MYNITGYDLTLSCEAYCETVEFSVFTNGWTSLNTFIRQTDGAGRQAGRDTDGWIDGWMDGWMYGQTDR